MTELPIKTGFYAYRHWLKRPDEDGEAGMILMAGPFANWKDALSMVPKCRAFAEKTCPRPDATFDICRMESRILPTGHYNAALWVPAGKLTP